MRYSSSSRNTLLDNVSLGEEITEDLIIMKDRTKYTSAKVWTHILREKKIQYTQKFNRFRCKSNDKATDVNCRPVKCKKFLFLPHLFYHSEIKRFFGHTTSVANSRYDPLLRVRIIFLCNMTLIMIKVGDIYQACNVCYCDNL